MGTGALLGKASKALRRAQPSRIFCRVVLSILAPFFILPPSLAFLFRYHSFMRARQRARFLAYQRAKRRFSGSSSCAARESSIDRSSASPVITANDRAAILHLSAR